MPTFAPNFPRHDSNGNGSSRLLSTPERVHALTELTGRGVTMAFIDSGFSMHPDVAVRILVHVDASTHDIQEQPYVLEPDELMSWHGQMTSAIAAGDGTLSGGLYRGIAYESSLVLIKVSTPRYEIREADILRGFQWLLAAHQRYNIRVVNVSVGGDFVSHRSTHPLHKAVRELVTQGVTVVVAAGNRGDHKIVPPASAAEAIVVGGYDDQNTLNPRYWEAYHSSYGYAYDMSHKPDLIAPARWIAAPILPGSQMEKEARWLAPLLQDKSGAALHRLLNEAHQDFGVDPWATPRLDDKLYGTLQNRIHEHKLVHLHYQHVDGTSVAAPIVASVIAQMLQVNPSLTPSQIKEILTETALRLPFIPPYQQGAGILNAADAVRLAYP